MNLNKGCIEIWEKTTQCMEKISRWTLTRVVLKLDMLNKLQLAFYDEP